MLKLLTREAPGYGVVLSEAQIERFERYLALLETWSEHTNLVGNPDSEVVQRRHFLESIALGAALRERQLLRPGTRVVDIGAGAGFPGIPIQIAWPELKLTLIEATAKKTQFMAEVVSALGLESTRVVTGRAETLGHDPELRGAFDLVLARAVARLPILVELALPFARVGGRVVAPKGSRAESEVAAAKQALEVLGGRAFVVPFQVPGPPQTIVVMLKERETPEAYPRREGVPAKAPL